MNLDNIAVIILNYNNAQLSIDAVTSLLSLHSDIKIVLVDNCSTDNSRVLLSDYSNNNNNNNLIIRFNDKNTGYAAGNNYGVREACDAFPNIEYICIMNPDVRIQDAQVLKSLVNSLKNNNNIGAITAETILNGEYTKDSNQSAWRFFNKKTMILQGGVFGRLFYKDLYYRHFDKNLSNIVLVDVVQGCFFIIRKNDFLHIDGFDEKTFLYYEEMILAKKLIKIDKKCAVLLGVYIQHNHKDKDFSMKIKSKKFFDMKCYLESRLYYLENYFEASDVYKHIASCLLYLDYRLKKFILSFILKD